MADTPVLNDVAHAAAASPPWRAVTWGAAALALQWVAAAAVDALDLWAGAALVAMVVALVSGALLAATAAWGARDSARDDACAWLVVVVASAASAGHIGLTGGLWAVVTLAGVGVVAALTFDDVGGLVRALAVVWLALAAGVGLCALMEARAPAAGVAAPRPEDVAQAAMGLAVAGLLSVLVLAQRARGAALLSEAGRAVAETSVRDGLTGSANRRGLEMVALPMIENARRQSEAVHCLFVDVDGFRKVNDVLGRLGGDEVLVAVADALRLSIRSTDVLARWSADQFVVIGPGTGTSPLELERRLRVRLVADAPVDPAVWTPQVSAGSARLVPWDDGDLDSLLRRAEQDMSMRRTMRRQGARARAADAFPRRRVATEAEGRQGEGPEGEGSEGEGPAAGRSEGSAP